jgi:hypothetical protein
MVFQYYPQMNQHLIPTHVSGAALLVGADGFATLSGFEWVVGENH